MVNDEIIVKYLVGEAEPHEAAMVEQWRKTSAENEKYLKQFETLWQTSAAVKHQQPVNVDMAWQKVKAKIHTEAKPKGRVFPISRKWLAAASIALLLGTGLFIFNLNTQPEAEMLTATVTGAARNLQLQDGSKITVKNGSFSYPETFAGEERKVRLNKGRAFFDIASDKEKPFIIEANQTLITVVGTEFEITTEAASTKVQVKEGKVKFHTPDGDIFLTAGMGAVYDNRTHQLTNIRSQSNNAFGYATGQLNFANTTLKQVVSDLNEYYGSSIELDNETIANCRITSTFNHDSLETVLNVITLTLNLEIEHLPDGQTIILKGKGCNP